MSTSVQLSYEAYEVGAADGVGHDSVGHAILARPPAIKSVLALRNGTLVRVLSVVGIKLFVERILDGELDVPSIDGVGAVAVEVKVEESVT